MVAAHTRMEQVADPLGLVWRSLRSGRLVIHPAPWDTTNTARYDNPLLDVYPDGVVFSFSPDVTEVEYIADDDQTPFGVQRTVVGVLNSFTVTRPDTTVYAVDDPVSVDRFGVRPFTASWIIDNDAAVDDLLAARAYASIQALPLRTTLEHDGFFPALAMLDHLDPVTVEHTAADARPTVTVTGTVRSIVEERTFQGSADGVATLAWQSTVQIDVVTSEATEALLPVESLALVETLSPGTAGPSSAEFSWVNPTQPSVTPTEVETRILERSLIWTAEDYPGTGADSTNVNWLAAETSYTFQVRLVRRVDGVATHVSPIREYVFTTPARIWPIPVPDGEDTGGEFGEPPDFDPEECELEVELQENDGTGWVTVDTFDDEELTDNGDGTWSLTTPIPNYEFNADSMYRFRMREICGTVIGDWIVGPEWTPPEDWTDPCPAPAALGNPPYDDANLILYVPKICSGAEDADPAFVFNGLFIVEAVSNIAGTSGSALAEILQLAAEPGTYTLNALSDPAWSDTAAGILAYGEAPQLTGKTQDMTIAVRCSVADDTVACVLADNGPMQLTASPVSGGGWRPGVRVYKTGSTISLAGTSVLDEDTVYYLAAIHDYATGDIKLYVNGSEDNDVGGSDNVELLNALPVWRVGAPPGSWVTDFAAWDRVLDVSELPGPVAPSVTIEQGASQDDPAAVSAVVFDVVFSEAVTGFATGDVTLSGTAGATTGTVTGSGATYTVTVTGMTTSGTVIATIAAGVCVSVSTSTANLASSSTDNTVTWYDTAIGPLLAYKVASGADHFWEFGTARSSGADEPDLIGSLDMNFVSPASAALETTDPTTWGDSVRLATSPTGVIRDTTSATFDINQDITFGFWIKFPNTSSELRCASVKVDANLYWYITRRADASHGSSQPRIKWQLNATDTGVLGISDGVPADTTSWIYVHAWRQYSTTSSADIWGFALNAGTAVTTARNAMIVGTPTTTQATGRLHLACESGGGGSSLHNGAINHVSIWVGKVLTSGERTEDYNAELGTLP